MSGFRGVLSLDGTVGLPASSLPCAHKVIRTGQIVVAESFIPKFKNDKALEIIEGLVVCMDGVTLNSRELISSSFSSDFPTAIAKRYIAHGACFPDELRGGFSGLVYDPASSTAHLFTNHFGTRYLFYTREPAANGAVYFSSSLLDIAECLRSAGLVPKLDPIAAYYLLTFGYMLDDRTLIEGVSKVEAGTTLEMRPGERPHSIRYYQYSNENIVDDGLDEAARRLYEGLSLAVRAGFEKDEEYGYRHLSLLSGGLDSRMNAFFAHRLGFRDVLTFTFGQSGCSDETIAASISRDLGFDHLFRQLDGGEFLKAGFPACVAANDGLILYSGSAHAITSYEMVDWNRYGLLHNGNLADASQGDYVDGDTQVAPEAVVWAYSKRLLDRIGPEIESVMARYPNQEAFAIATRGVNAILNGSVSAQGLTDTDEPFLHPDLVAMASRMPPKFKAGEKAFIAMIERYFPEAARYPWQKWGIRPSLAGLERRKLLVFKAAHRARRLMEKTAAAISGKPDPADMNPFDYWLRSSGNLRGFFAEARTPIAEFASGRDALGKDTLSFFDEGSILEKTQAMTLAAAVERLGLR